MSTTTNSIVSNALTQLGYTNVSGLSAYWNDNSNTLTFNFNSATNTQISVAEYISSTSEFEDEFNEFVSLIASLAMSDMGYTNINNLQTVWATETNELVVTFSSANVYHSSVGNLYLSSGTFYIDLDDYGSVSYYASEAFNSTYGWLYGNIYDLTSSEKETIKLAFWMIDSTERIVNTTTADDIAMAALESLGYTQVLGLTSSWNASTQTSTIHINSAVVDGTPLTNGQVVVKSNSNGEIISYYSQATIYGTTYYYNQSDLNEFGLYVVTVANIFNSELYAITSNHDFTNGSATIVFDDFGNITSFTTSITHSDVGTFGDSNTSGLSSAELGIIGNAYNQLTINNPPTAIADNASTSEDTLVTIDVLANDTDADGDTLSVTSATATNGTVTINANGTLTYQGNQDFNGTDVINYTVSDGELSDTATVTVTVNAVNDAPNLTSSMSGHTSILTVDADSAYVHNTSIHFNDVEDGNTGGSYSVSGNPAWLTIDTSTGTLSGTPTNDDAATISITVTYTDSSSESISDTYALTINPIQVTTTAQLIQVRNATSVTKSQISIDEYGTDYTNGNTDKLMKFELWIDATELSSFGIGATEIRAYQFDLDWNDLEVGALNFPTIAGTNIGFNAANPANADITFNSDLGGITLANSTAIVDTNVSNDGPPSFLGTEQLIGTFYVNPMADLETISVSVNEMLVVTDTGNIIPNDYLAVMEISSINATIQTDASNYLDSVSLNYFKDDVDTGIFTLVEAGGIEFDQALDFDTVKLSDPAAYNDTSSIQADDAVAILRDIVFLDIIETDTTTWHAADVNNDGRIAADDAVAILRHIVFLDEIDTFDLIDNTTGNRVTNLNPDATLGEWTIVANGDVNSSGSFYDAYTVAVDIV